MTKKKFAILAVTITILGIIGGVSLATQPEETIAEETNPVVTKLDNHEARITNAENNIEDLQAATSTPPSPDNVSVPTSTQEAATSPTPATNPQPAAEPTPEPVTVVSYREIPLEGGNADCEYIYSDGSTYQFHWKTVNPQGSWVTDGNGQNGHWVQTTQTRGYCDDRAIGREKVN